MAATRVKADVVIVSNRGPLSFALDDAGRPVPAGSAGIPAIVPAAGSARL